MTMTKVYWRASRTIALLFGLGVSACDGEPLDEAAGSRMAEVAGQLGTTVGGAGKPGGQASGGAPAQQVPVDFPLGTAPTFPTPAGSPGFGGAGTFSAAPPVLGGPVIRAEVAPPPISGGTMLTTRDGKLLVAADSDRDQIYFIDRATRSLLHIRKLTAGDEPGRLVEDTAGRIHVALRSGHAIASLPRDAQSVITRRAVCDLPRGLAYDEAHDALLVVCAEGKLLTLPAAPEAAVTRTLDIERGARDVLVRGDDVYVTQFRSAELLHLKLDGTMVERHAPPSFATDEFVIDANNQARMERVASRPTTAWRLLDIPGKGTTILHERARGGEVQVQPGGYGAGQCGSGIVQTSITFGMDTGRALSTDITDAALAIDMAADPEGILLAIVSAGNWGSSNQLHLYTLSAVDQVLAQTPPTDSVPDSANDAGVSAGGTGGSIAGMIPGSNNCVGAERTMDSSVGHAVAVTFVSPYEIAVQEREPAGISFFDVRTNQLRARLDLDQPSRFDTGHAIFHLRASSGIACASCHAEAGDDSHVWRFHGIGARRTQSLRGGILGTEPLHWNGDMKDFPTLVQEVFVGRMSGFSPSAEQSTALARWIDRQPALVATARDAKSAERGQALFESEAVGCATCHDGTHLTNNKFAEVGTGAMFQVPSLRGVSFRMPLMHDGCANTLLQRFDSVCGGGDKHGHTSQLDKAQVADLVSYLETL